MEEIQEEDSQREHVLKMAREAAEAANRLRGQQEEECKPGTEDDEMHHTAPKQRDPGSPTITTERKMYEQD